MHITEQIWLHIPNIAHMAFLLHEHVEPMGNYANLYATQELTAIKTVARRMGHTQTSKRTKKAFEPKQVTTRHVILKTFFM